MGFMDKHQLPAVIFKATSIIQKIGFQLMVCYKSHLVKLHAYFLRFFPKSTWKTCDSCLRGTTEPVAAQRDEEEHAPTTRQANLQPVHDERLKMPPWGRDLTQPHLIWPAGLVWGQTLCIRALVGDEDLSQMPPY